LQTICSINQHGMVQIIRTLEPPIHNLECQSSMLCLRRRDPISTQIYSQYLYRFERIWRIG
jgi:hypothetical protein